MSGVPRLPFKPQLRWLPGKKPTTFTTHFSEKHRASLTAQVILNDRSNPRHYMIKRKYEEKERNGLWWAPTVSLAVSPKRTVRSWCTRRLRSAFREELEARGLNELGQRKAASGPAVFWGTLIMYANVHLVTAKYSKVREEAGWTLDALLAAFKPPQKSQRPNAGGGKPQMQHPGGASRGVASKGKGNPPRRQQ